MIKSLFISYNGAAEHLSHSQVIPYLKGLSERGVKAIMLSYEKPEAIRDEETIRGISEDLRRSGIEWHFLKYHKRPGMIAKIYDIIAGIMYSAWLARKHKIDILHARSTIPAVIASTVSFFLGIDYIFDMRGLLAEEYADGGLWRRGSLKYRLVNKVERRLLASSDAIVMLTDKIRGVLTARDGCLSGYDRSRIYVIPCCVDLDKFTAGRAKDAAVASRLGLGGRFVFGYVGSLGTWYMVDEMTDFFLAAKESMPEAHFSVLTQSGRKHIDEAAAKRRVGISDISVSEEPPHRVPLFMSTIDAGLFFIKPSFSKQASSPTKLAEFLACGVPVVINSGVGDTEAVVRGERVGVVVSDFSDSSYRAAAEKLKELLKQGEPLRQRCRQAAERHFSMNKGCDKYMEIYMRLAAGRKAPGR